jgi:DNA polymerase I-like protein with 3'-5' exonuclease and polymerase domains
MYYAAVLAGDRELQKVFSSGGDFHSSIAKSVFGLMCSVGEVKSLYPELRQSAKAISFGILYGSGAKSVAETVSKATGREYSTSQAQEDIKTYFDKFHVLKSWLDASAKSIKENGFIYSFFGRKRRLSNVFSSDKAIAAQSTRSGVNAIIQNLSSDINLLAAMNTQRECKEKGLDANIFMLVHDSVSSVVKDDVLEEYKEILARNTQKDYGCSIPGTPIGIDVEVGNDYSFGKYEVQYGFVEGKLARLPSGD